jgi:hypothetical protein
LIGEIIIAHIDDFDQPFPLIFFIIRIDKASVYFLDAILHAYLPEMFMKLAFRVSFGTALIRKVPLKDGKHRNASKL